MKQTLEVRVRKERNVDIKRRLTKIVKLEELEDDFRLKIRGKSEKNNRHYRIYEYKKLKKNNIHLKNLEKTK